MRAAKIEIILRISTRFAQKITFVFCMDIKPIAHISSPFKEKFGIPRQSRLAEDCPATVVFEPGYGLEDAVRGIEEFSHIWLIWGFSAAPWDGNFTVRPPRLGGNRRIGVFASRSPFRPNSLAMSAVKLVSIEMTSDRGPLLHVSGADLLDGTPIYDIKPYIPYADCIPEATDGYTAPTKSHRLQVEFAPGVLEASAVSETGSAAHGAGSEAFAVSETCLPAHGEGIDSDTLSQIEQLLSLDPRVSYDTDPDKVWGMAYGRYNVRFKVCGGTAVVLQISMPE